MRALTIDFAEQDASLQLRAYASKIFDLLTEALGSDEYYYGSNK